VSDSPARNYGGLAVISGSVPRTCSKYRRYGLEARKQGDKMKVARGERAIEAAIEGRRRLTRFDSRAMRVKRIPENNRCSDRLTIDLVNRNSIGT